MVLRVVAGVQVLVGDVVQLLVEALRAHEVHQRVRVGHQQLNVLQSELRLKHLVVELVHDELREVQDGSTRVDRLVEFHLCTPLEEDAEVLAAKVHRVLVGGPARVFLVIRLGSAEVHLSASSDILHRFTESRIIH